ncbi:MAG: thiol reductant ABC exporter subunit CydD [Anaerolineaceae bacterium]
MNKRLLQSVKFAPHPILWTIIASFVAGLLMIAQAYLLSRIIAEVFLNHQNLQQVWSLMIYLLLTMILRSIFTIISDGAAGSGALKIKNALREQLYDKLLHAGPIFLRGEQSGAIQAAVIEGIEALEPFFSQYLPQIILAVIIPLSMLVAVFPIDWLSGVVLLVTAPLIPIFMYLIGKSAQKVTGKQWTALSRMSAYFLDSLQGLTTLKIFNQSKARAARVQKSNEAYRMATLKVLRMTFLSAFALELVSTISTAVVAVEIGLRLLYGHIEFQQAFFILILAPEFYLPLRMLGQRFHSGMSGVSAANQIFSLMDRIPEPLKDENSGIIDQPPTTFDLEFKHVFYRYPERTDEALRDIHFRVEPYQKVAIVGKSGAGKTTLFNLILRFAEPESGEICLAGIPINQYSKACWEEIWTWVPQMPYLFKGSLLFNITLGKPDATHPQIEKAIWDAHLTELVEKLPAGLNTEISEGGENLSQGEIQRIALARAFIRNTPCILLDEPTSHLDVENERLFNEIVAKLTERNTVFTIAHRLTTVQNADQILVMDAGQLVETGKHEALFSKKGRYYELLQRAAGGV